MELLGMFFLIELENTLSYISAENFFVLMLFLAPEQGEN